MCPRPALPRPALPGHRIVDECLRHGIEAPTFEERGGAVIVTFRAEITSGTRQAPSGHQVGTMSALSRDQVRVLEAARVERTLTELINPTGRTDRTKFRDQVLWPLLAEGWLEMTIPDKPRSSNQRYRTTPAGLKALGEFQK